MVIDYIAAVVVVVVDSVVVALDSKDPFFIRGLLTQLFLFLFSHCCCCGMRDGRCEKWPV